MNIYKERKVYMERKCKVLSLCDKGETTVSHKPQQYFLNLIHLFILYFQLVYASKIFRFT